MALDLIGFGIVVPILGQYAERFGASGLTVGLLFASFSLAQLVFSPLLGRLSDRIGRKPVIVISLVGTAIGSFVTGAANVVWLLFAGRIIDGASGGSLSVAQAAVADMAPPDQRPRLIGLLGAAFGVGFVLGPAIGGLAALGGPHVPFYVAAGLAAVNAIAAAVRLPETRRVGPAIDVGAAGGSVEVSSRRIAMPMAPLLRKLALVGFISVVSFAAFEAVFSLFAQRRFGLHEAGTSAVFLCIGLVLVAVQGGAYGRFVEHMGAARLYTAGLALLAVGLLVLSVSTVWPVLVVALLFLAVGQGVASPSITAMVTQHAPIERRGEALGFQQSAYAVGRIVGPPLAGALFDHAGIWSPFVAGAVLAAIALGLTLGWRLHHG